MYSISQKTFPIPFGQNGNYRSVPFPFSTTLPFCRLSVLPFTVYTCISCSYTKESFEMPYTDYLKRRALAFYNQGLAPSAIADALEAESLTATKQGLTKRYLETGTLGRHRNTRSHSTILRNRRSLGWTFRGSAYCQMIRDVNKTKPFRARGRARARPGLPCEGRPLAWGRG